MDSPNHNQPDNGLNQPNTAGSPQSPLPPQDDDAKSGAPAAPSEPLTLGDWFRTNGSTILTGMLLIAAMAVLNEMYFRISYSGVLMVVVGLGFIIFIHELGHFLVAKWCDVHVTTFSIGFGPPLPFCSYTWGETTYKLAVFPLGGYVQMVGQVDGDESADSSEDDPRSYKNKTVWQRMAIISAGVTMNAIFACIAFTVIFLGPGRARQAAVVWAVDSGKPAFEKGIRTGAQIVRVNNIDHPFFEDLKFETVASLGRIEIQTQLDGGSNKLLTYDITPHQGSFRSIGILPSVELQLASRKHQPEASAPASPRSAAGKAQPQFEFDDVVVGVTDPDFPQDPSKMALPDDPRNPAGGMKDFFEFQRRMSLLADKVVTIQVLRGPEGAKKSVDISVPPEYYKALGVRMSMGQIVMVRAGSAAAEKVAGVLTPRTNDSGQKLDGDVIEKVEFTEPDGKVTKYEKGVDLDPIRLPFQLKSWAERLWTARGNKPPPNECKVTFYLKRQGEQNAGPVYLSERAKVELEWDYDWRFDRVLPLDLKSPQAIPELGLAYQVKNQVDGVDKGSSGQLLREDEIVDLNFVMIRPNGKEKEHGWFGAAIKGTEWAKLFLMMQSPDIAKVKLKVKRAGSEQPIAIEVTPQEDQTWPQDDRGLLFIGDKRIERADNAVQAVQMGFRDTYRSIMQVYLSLRGLAAGTISVDNVGGPVQIAAMAYEWAHSGMWQFLFFLALISVNLAVLNFLPIPVLDGGHMVFLIYEKLRGKPATEGVRVGATYAGLLLLGCLMIFVLFLDIRRLVGG